MEMEQKTRDLFKTLTELPGAPGFESEVRQFVRDRITPHVDEVMTDGIGSIFGKRVGDEAGPRIMVAGHMDEVAFMVTRITENGMLYIQPLGGWWSQVLMAQRFDIVTNDGLIPGVVASTPPHLLGPDAMSKPMDMKQMFIDIGADTKEEAESWGVRPGLPAVPTSDFTPLKHPKKIMAKAWDNRYGVGLAVELLEETTKADHPNILFSGATVQEEVGLRGAQTAAEMIRPDVALVLDASPANDASGNKTEFGQLGEGALVRILDRVMVMSPEMRDFLLDTASDENIKTQYFVSPGGTDAGRIHMSGEGVPTAVIGVAARYIHTHASILHTDDYDAAKALLKALVKRLDRSTMETLRASR